jgi:hypothetical protein
MMRLAARTLILVVLLVTPAGAAAHDAGTPPATLATFAGYWSGHTRGLQITRTGHAQENVDDGCCHRVVNIQYELSDPRGVTSDATVRARVTAVRLYNKAIYWTNRSRRPRVGQVARLRLKNHVITDPITDQIFCGLRARPIGRCGA